MPSWPPDPPPRRRPPPDDGGEVAFRSRLRDTILAVAFTVPAVGSGVGAVVAAVPGQWETAAIAGVLALGFGLVAVLLWRLRAQRIVLGVDALVYDVVHRTHRVPYAEIAAVDAGFAPGLTVTTHAGRRHRLPWAPQRTASGFGTTRLEEIRRLLEVRAAAARDAPEEPGG